MSKSLSSEERSKDSAIQRETLFIEVLIINQEKILAAEILQEFELYDPKNRTNIGAELRNPLEYTMYCIVCLYCILHIEYTIQKSDQ